MKIIFSSQAWEDYLFRQESDKKTIQKINEMIKEIQRHPFAGKGKPEPLRGDLKGYWSRRISLVHRLVYSVRND